MYKYMYMRIYTYMHMYMRPRFECRARSSISTTEHTMQEGSVAALLRLLHTRTEQTGSGRPASRTEAAPLNAPARLKWNGSPRAAQAELVPRAHCSAMHAVADQHAQVFQVHSAISAERR